MTTLEDFPVGSLVRRLYDGRVARVAHHQPRRSASLPDALGVEIDGDVWSGTLQAWEPITPLDALAVEMRRALTTRGLAAARSEYRDVESDVAAAAQRTASQAETNMWRLFYDIASAAGETPRPVLTTVQYSALGDLRRFGRLFGVPPGQPVERGTVTGFSERTLQALVDAGLARWDGNWTRGVTLPSIIPNDAQEG